LQLNSKPDTALHADMNNPALQTIIIEPTKGWKLPRLRELWDYRELLYFLVWRDLAIRYKQTITPESVQGVFFANYLAMR
jgi:hypothetical protein